MIVRLVKRADVRDNLDRPAPELEGLERRYLWTIDRIGAASNGRSGDA